MKSILFAALLATSTLNAQITVISPRLTDSTAAVVYIGVENPIEIRGLDKPENYIVTISGAGSSITKVGTGKYIIRAGFPDSLTLTISKAGVVKLRKKYAVDRIPEGKILLAGTTEEKVTKQSILANPELEWVLPGCLYKHGIEVISFTMTIDVGPEIVEVPATSGTLSEKQIQLVRNAASDATITFDHIRVQGADNQSRLAPSLIRYLK